MKSRNILYVITKSNRGGAQRYVADLVTALIQEGGYDITVAAGGDGRLFDECGQAGADTHRLRYAQREVRVFKEILLAFELLFLYIREKPDVIHLNSTKIGGLGAFIGRIYNVFGGGSRIIFTAHGWGFMEKRFSSFAQKIYMILQAFTVILAHKTIAVSMKTKYEFVRRFHFGNRRIVVIHNGIASYHIDEKRTARTKLSRHIDESEDIFRERTLIGTIAELHHNKGLDVAVRALADPLFENTVYVIVGSGEKENYLRRLIEKHEVTDRVLLAGFIPDARTLISAFDMFLLPSRKEGFPYTLLEAGRAGLPTIATRVGGIPDIVTDGESGILITINDEKALKKAVLTYMNNPDIADRYGKTLKKRVENEFSRENMIEQTHTLYKQLLS